MTLARLGWFVLVFTLGACGGRVMDESLGGAPASESTTSPGTSASAPPASSALSAPKRTLDELRAGVAGVWEGDVTSPVGGLVKPASKVRIELAPDGLYIGTCLAPDEHAFGRCSTLPNIADGKSPFRTWQIDRLTAGFEGMGVIRDRTEPSFELYIKLHRVRLSADGQRLEFTVMGRDDDAHVFQYWLRRVAR